MAVFVSRSGRPVVHVLLAAVAHAVAAVASAVAQPEAEAPPPRADEPRLAAAHGDDVDREEPAIGEDGGVFLPADRGKERQLDR